MICQMCGAQADEVRPGHYRCKYCTNEFDASAVNTPVYEQTVNNSRPSNVLSGEDIYERAIDSVVEIYALSPDGKGSMCSSGFVVSERGFVLTNAHAVLDAFGQLCKKIQVKTRKGVFNAFPIALGKPADGKNDSVDLCLLYVDGLKEKANEIGDATVLKNGQKVYLIGNSLGEGTCITSGIISDKQRAIPGLSYPYIMTDAAANHGNSGGPLYNEKGEVVGVLVAGIDGAKGMNYAIPSNVVDAFMSYVVNGSEIKNATLGELDKYSQNATTYSMSMAMAFSGVNFVVDVIDYIVKSGAFPPYRHPPVDRRPALCPCPRCHSKEHAFIENGIFVCDNCGYVEGDKP